MWVSGIETLSHLSSPPAIYFFCVIAEPSKAILYIWFMFLQFSIGFFKNRNTELIFIIGFQFFLFYFSFTYLF